MILPMHSRAIPVSPARPPMSSAGAVRAFASGAKKITSTKTT
jgi:hypothetical protein